MAFLKAKNLANKLKQLWQRHAPGEVNAFIERLVPYEKYAHFVKELIFTRVREFRLYKNLAGVLGLVGLFFASSGQFEKDLWGVHTVDRRGSLDLLCFHRFHSWRGDRAIVPRAH